MHYLIYMGIGPNSIKFCLYRKKKRKSENICKKGCKHINLGEKEKQNSFNSNGIHR